MTRREGILVAAMVLAWSIPASILVFGPPIHLARLASSTLAPRFEKGDFVAILRWRIGWQPARGDIVTFLAPEATGERAGEPFIKRVAGLPAEQVSVREGVLHVDGQPIDEPWRNLEDGPGPDFGPAVVPDGHLFLLGDNRGRSYDSRYWGFLAVDEVAGVALRR